MRKLSCFLLSIALLTVFFISSKAAVVDSIVITQVDTFALKGMIAQPVLKIKICISGSGTINLNDVIVHLSNQDNSDVDSVALYTTNNNNRFSLADFPGEYNLVGSRKAIKGDSASFAGLSRILESGIYYFWVTMDLNKYSKASHTLDAYIKPGRINIGGNYYPATIQDPSDNLPIADIYYRENFENVTTQNEPAKWEQEYANGAPRWKSNNGGYSINPNPGTGHPSSAKSGNYNVMMWKDNYNKFKTKLVSPPIDLSLATRPLLTFYHSQVFRNTTLRNDELHVLYKVGLSGTWDTLEFYELATPNTWLKRSLFFPEKACKKNVYLAFEGTTQYGWGVCVDSMVIFETWIIDRMVNSETALNPITEMVPQDANGNAILRTNIRIKGNTGQILLNSLTVKSGNTSINDIKTNGVKLYITNDSVFLSPVQLGTAKSFSGDQVTFSGLNKILETGDNYIWVTYDIKPDAVPGHTLDAYIDQGGIGLSVAGIYPADKLDPPGNREIQQTLFFDDFEGTPQWNMTGEFEIDKPLGRGGYKGMPDPTAAFSGLQVLGTDLTGDGDYEAKIPASNPYTATSPLIDGSYFKNIQFQFYRYLNMDYSDTAAIEYKLEGSSEWKLLWMSRRRFIEPEWQKQTYSNLTFLSRKKFNIRFVLGPTDFLDNYSGWNIDYLFFTGDSIPFDASVSRYITPNSACGLTGSEHVTVCVKNIGPKPLVNTPIKLSIDGGKTFITEYIPGSIAVNDSIHYTFSAASDFSKAAIYKLVVKVAYPGDNYPDNDSIVQNVVAFPTYTLPYYTGFEQDTTFWFAEGLHSSWFEGYPGGTLIKRPAEGSHCWKTDNSGFFNPYEFSHVTSPCFSFTGKELPIIDIKFNTYTNVNKDGAILEYSIDEGSTWNYAREDNFPFPWNWYNDTITSLKHKGWTGRTVDGGGLQEWKQGRQILPAAVANQNRVMFRFVFKADSTSSRVDGFAFDNFKLYDAPHDIGVTAITGLTDPACQYANSPYLNVNIKNFGSRRMVPGDKVIVGASVNGVVQAVDTFLISAYLNKEAVLNYTFKKPVDFSATGSYVIKAFTMIEPDQMFYGTVNNDTATVSLTVHQNPITGLPDTLYTARIDTLRIRALYSSNYTYYWQGSSTQGTSIFFPVPDVGDYALRVQDKTNGCQTFDTVFVKSLIPDIAVNQIFTPGNHCGYKTPVHPVIRIRNEGTDTLRFNHPIPVGVKLDNGTVLNESVILSKMLAPDSFYTATLNLLLDVSAIKTYSLKVFSKMQFDTVRNNDTAFLSFQIYGYPTTDLGAENVIIYDTTYRITAPAGFTSYSWSNTADSITRFNTVKQTGWYKVTVTDGNLCPATDSVHVYLKIRDVKPHLLVSPRDTCINTEPSNVILRFQNAGTDSITSNDSILLSYQLNGAALVADTLKPSGVILPGDFLDYTFKSKENLMTNGIYDFSIKVAFLNSADFKPWNDTAHYMAQVFGLPKPDLGVPVESPFALQLVLDPGKFSRYEWQDNSTDSVYVITKNHYANPPYYQVTVWDTHNCTATSNKVFRILNIYDVDATFTNLPDTICDLISNMEVKIKVTNVGNLQILPEEIIKLKYQINGGPFSKTDTLFIPSNFNPDQVLNHTFLDRANLSLPNDYQIKVFVDYGLDVNIANDTLTHLVVVSETPEIEFDGAEHDSLIVDFPHVLDAGPGFSDYLWSTFSTDQTITVSESGMYSVIVTSARGCKGSSSVRVIQKTYDLTISGFNLPATNCELTDSVTIGVEITNDGSAKLNNEPFTLTYKLNNAIDKSQSFNFTGNRGEKRTFLFSGTEDLSAKPFSNTFDVTLINSKDTLVTNNFHTFEVFVSGYPAVSFGEAKDDTIWVSHFPHELNPGAYGADSYLWQDNSTDSVYSVKKSGWYSVTVTKFGCSTSDSVYVKSTLSSRMLSDQVEFDIFPNPASDVLWIQLNLKFSDDAVLELVSLEGKIVKTIHLAGKQKYFEELELGNIPRGLYYIRIYNKKWIVTDKVLLQ